MSAEILMAIALWCGQPFVVQPGVMSSVAGAELKVHSCRSQILECMDPGNKTIGVCLRDYAERQYKSLSDIQMRLLKEEVAAYKKKNKK